MSSRTGHEGCLAFGERCSAFGASFGILCFCSVAVLFGMGCLSGIGCFVQRLVRPRFVARDLYTVLFGIGVLFGYGVLFGVLKLLNGCWRAV